MGRKPNHEKIETIFQTVQQNPGVHPARIAELLGVNRSDITRTLPNLEQEGFFLTEDSDGGLWPFENKR